MTEPDILALTPLARALYEAWKVLNEGVKGEMNPEYAQRLADEMERVKPFVVVTPSNQWLVTIDADTLAAIVVLAPNAKEAAERALLITGREAVNVAPKD